MFVIYKNVLLSLLNCYLFMEKTSLIKLLFFMDKTSLLHKKSNNLKNSEFIKLLLFMEKTSPSNNLINLAKTCLPKILLP